MFKQKQAGSSNNNSYLLIVIMDVQWNLFVCQALGFHFHGNILLPVSVINYLHIFSYPLSFDNFLPPSAGTAVGKKS